MFFANMIIQTNKAVRRVFELPYTNRTLNKTHRSKLPQFLQSSRHFLILLDQGNKLFNVHTTTLLYLSVIIWNRSIYIIIKIKRFFKFFFDFILTLEEADTANT